MPGTLPGMAAHEALRSVDVDSVLGSAGDAGGGALIAAPGAGKKLVVHAYVLTLSAAAAAKFRTATGGGGTALRTCRASAAGQGQAESMERPDFLFELPANTALFLHVSAAATVSGGVTYSIVTA
jgi:hypothetical protein